LKIIPPQSQAEKPTGRFSKAQMQREMARQAAQEKALARYITITCGHVTDLETQHRYAVWRPKRGLVFCEIDDQWLPAKPPPPRPEYPQQPLF